VFARRAYGGPASNALLHNDGRGSFVNVSATAAAVLPVLQGGVFLDFDGDGDLDLAIGGTTRLLRNDSWLVFTDVSAAWLPPGSQPANGCAFGDVDGDGDLDLVVASATGTDVLLLNTRNSFVAAASYSLPVPASAALAGLLLQQPALVSASCFSRQGMRINVCALPTVRPKERTSARSSCTSAT